MSRSGARCPLPVADREAGGQTASGMFRGQGMRGWLAMLGIVASMVAGCAGDKANKPPAAAVAPMSLLAQAPTLSDEETLEFLKEAAVRKLTAICQPRQTAMTQMACVRESLLQGFDSTGEAAKHCGVDITAPGTLRCIISGAIGYEIALRADLDAARAYDWNDGRGGLRTAARQLRDKIVEGCTGSTPSNLDACVLSGVADGFALPEGQREICIKPDDRAWSFDCLLRSFMIQRIGGAIEKMTVEDDEQI
ncbi:MAG TPA: hypothetical protein VG742_20830 [Dongiaceae bacterium]|nr:hypothetical protein [Dongiaceae bacterium]